nr:uncharacterized protein LOC113400490 [Vanessa tameamea]
MYSSFCILYLSLISLARAFFLLGDNQEPVLFCIKVCPLYCSPRRHDEDASSLIYVDEPPPFIPIDNWHEHEFIPHHFDPYYFCKPPKPTTTTTTPAPTTMMTTTEEPSWICMVCMKKCTKYPKS